MKQNKGISQIVIMVIMLVLAIALPLTTKLVQKSQENRSKATAASCVMGDKTRVDGMNICGNGGGAYGTNILYKCESGVWKDQGMCGFNSCINIENTDPKTAACGGSDRACTERQGTCNGPTSAKTGDTCTTASGANGAIQTGLCLSNSSFDKTCCVTKTTLATPAITQTAACRDNYGYCVQSASGMQSGIACTINNTLAPKGFTNTNYACGAGAVCCVQSEFIPPSAPAAAAITCSSNGVNAVCALSSDCAEGSVYASTNGDGYFPDCGTGKTCCVKNIGKQYVNSAKCAAVGGHCGDFPVALTEGYGCVAHVSYTESITGTIRVGLCGGDTTVKCCAPSGSSAPPVTGTDAACIKKDGTCKVWETSTVGGSCNSGTGKIEKGLCMSRPTDTTYRCCVPNPVTPAPIVCTPNCSCAAATLIGQTCSDGCNGTCVGTKQPACTPNCACGASTLVGQTCSDGCGGTCAGTKPTPTPIPPTATPTPIPPTATPIPPVCTTGTKECTSATAFRTCISGQWGVATTCGAALPLCVSGVCQARDTAEATVNIKMAFAGVKPNNDQCVTNLWRTIIRIANRDGNDILENNLNGIPQKTSEVNSKGEIIYNLSAVIADVPDAGVNSLSIFMKGPKHMSLKYGINGQESWYNTFVGQLNLIPGANTYDFSKYSLLAGDVTGSQTGVPDGKIDARDYSFIKGKSQPTTTGNNGVDLVGDIDGNCQVNAGDVFLIKQSLIEINGQVY